MPGTAARTLACAAALFARSLNLRYDGIAIASRIPMMMMTTRSSMSVKPSSLLSRICRLFSIRLELFQGLEGYRLVVTYRTEITQPTPRNEGFALTHDEVARTRHLVRGTGRRKWSAAIPQVRQRPCR